MKKDLVEIVFLRENDADADDDNDDDDDDDELFLWNGWPAKGVWPYFLPGPLSEISSPSSPSYNASQVSDTPRAGFEPPQNPEFKLSWMKLCNSDNHNKSNICCSKALQLS